MHRQRHLYERVCSFENLVAASREALRGKRSRLPGAAFLAEEEKELVALREELCSGAYQHGPYTYFMVHDPKDREVAAARFRDRVVHHAVVRVIEPIFERRFIEDSFACRLGKGTHAAMRRAAGFARAFPMALKCDVRKYFASIDHSVLLGQLADVVADEELLGLIRGIVDSHADGVSQEWQAGGELFDVALRKRGLPIGNLTSQFFANVYLNPLDHFAKHGLRAKGYVRYMDDFVLFGERRSQLRDWGQAVKEKLAELLLRVHPDKYRLVPTWAGVDFVGFVVFEDGRIRVRSSSVRRFDRRFRHMLWEVERGVRRASDLTARVGAWRAHTEHAQSYGLRRAVLCRRRGKG